MADEKEQEPPENLRSLQDELAALVRRSLAQRAQAEEIGVRMREVADQISKLIKLSPPKQENEPE
jgi:hypothetical protein